VLQRPDGKRITIHGDGWISNEHGGLSGGEEGLYGQGGGENPIFKVVTPVPGPGETKGPTPTGTEGEQTPRTPVSGGSGTEPETPAKPEPTPGTQGEQTTAPTSERPAHETPGTPAYKLAELDRTNAPDEAYRDALSTGSKDPLKPGETWRSRLVKWVEQERPTETTSTSTNRKVDYRWEVREADALTPAEGDLQPRDRQSRIQAQDQQNDIYANFDPERLHASPEADRGAPIVAPVKEDPMNTIEAGNNRVEVLKRIHAGTEQGDMTRSSMYRDMIQRVTGQDVSRMTAPVLVRRRVTPMTPEERRAFVQETNVGATQRMSATEQAQVDASNITHDHLATLDPNKELTSAANRDFVNKWVSTLPQTERNAVQDADGYLSAEGVRRLNAAILGKAYGDKGSLARGLESTNDEIKSISGAMADAAPAIAKLKSGVEKGDFPKEYDISSNIADAAEKVRIAREKGVKRDDILNQADAFDPLHPVTGELVRSMFNKDGTRAASRTAMADTLRQYARSAATEAEPKGLLPGDKGLSPLDILKAINDARDAAIGKKGAKAPGQGGLFDTESGMRSDALTARDMAHLNARADVVSPRDFVLSGHEDPEQLAAVILPDGRLFQFRPDAYDIETSHQGFNEHTDGNNYAEVTAYKKSIGVSVQGDSTPAMEQTINRLRAQAKREAVAFHTDEDLYGSRSERLSDQEVDDMLASRRGFRRKAPAPGEPERLPPRAKPQPHLEPVVTPNVGDPLTFEDHAYSPGTPEYRKAFHDALRGSGRDPDTMVNAPIEEQNRVLAKQLEDEYGFAKVNVDPKVDPKVTRDQLLNMHNNMNNMAAALGWSRETIALNGRLALHLVPYNFRGESWYGAYSFADRTIHISGGSNSYAHEHWHAIDDYLTDLLHNNPNRKQLLTWSARAGALDPKDPVQSAFARVLNAMSYNRGEEMLRRLRLEQTAMKLTKAGQPTGPALAARREIENLDKGASKLRIGPSDLRKEALGGPSPQYWASYHELFARVGEAYTAYRMEAAGHDTAGVVKSNKAYQDRALAEIRHRYPNWMDRLDMFHAFDQLTAELDHASTLSRGQPRATPTSEMYDLKPWGTRPADMRPGMLTSLREDLGALRWSNLFGKDHEPVFRDPNAPPPPPTYDTRQGEKKGLPTPKSLAVRKADDIAMTWNSALGNLERIIRQIPPKARPYIQALRDKLGVDPGTGRLIGPTYEERTRMYERPAVSQFEDIMKDTGLVGRITKRPYLTAEQNAMLRHTLTTGEMTYPVNAHDLTGTGPRLAIPPEIRKAAAAIRSHVLDAHYDRMKAAGMDVPYAKSGYFPRVYNDKAILADHAGFVRDRAKLNQVIFDKDLDNAPDSVSRLNQWWRETDASTRNSGLFDPDARDAMNQTTRNLRRIRAIDEELAAGGAINPNTHDPIKLGAERDKLVQENQDLHDLWRDHVRDQLARHEAENVFDAIASGNPTRFNTLGPDSKFTKGRTLPPEADQIMRAWMHHDVLSMIPGYVHGVSRKVAFTELFGQDGHGIQKAITDAIELGGMHSAFNEPIKQIVETVTGRSMRSNNPALERITNLASSVGALITLPGASISAIGEPFGTLLAGGSPKMLFKTFANMSGAAFRTGTAAERMAVLRAIGGTQSRLQGAASASRFSDYSGSPTIEKFMHNYFELALSPAVRWIRAATLGAGTDHMKVLLRLATDPAKGRYQLNRQADAKTLLRDWFVNDAQMPEMRKFLETFPDLPTREAIENHPMGGLYEVAANRMLNRMSQDPTAAEKPMGALQNPMVNMMAQLTAFPYGFWRNVMEPVLHKAGHARQREWDRQIANGANPGGAAFQAEAARFRSWVGTAMAGMALLAGTGLMYVPRTYLFNHPAWKKHEDDGDLGDWLLSNTVSASGMAGPLDAVGQAITSLRYRSDTSALMEGPYLATEMRYLTDIVKGVGHAISGKGDVGTNTEVYNAVQALGQLTVKPAFLAGLTALANRVPAGGPLSGLLAAASVAGTSTTVSRAITDSIAGERGTTIKKEPKDPFAPPPLEGLPPLDESVSGQEDAAAGGLPSWMLGLTDDVLMPMLKIVPGAGKLAIGGAAAASGVGLLGYRGHQYKTRGEPPEKAH
jgi:hypothetical protein